MVEKNLKKLKARADTSDFGRLKNEMYYGHEKEYTSFEEVFKTPV